jgi:hypothetical protein
MHGPPAIDLEKGDRKENAAAKWPGKKGASGVRWEENKVSDNLTFQVIRRVTSQG